jgi:hypothetical protein
MEGRGEDNLRFFAAPVRFHARFGGARPRWGVEGLQGSAIFTFGTAKADFLPREGGLAKAENRDYLAGPDGFHALKRVLARDGDGGPGRRCDDGLRVRATRSACS